MKKAIIFIGLCFYINYCQSQITFNKYIDFQLYFTAITGIHATDSCYYVSGTILDTLPHPTGNIFAKLDLKGNILYSKKLSSPSKTFETWFGGLEPTLDGHFLATGYAADATATKSILIKYNEWGDTILTKEYLNPLYPNETFMSGRDMISLNNNQYALLNGFNNNGGNDIAFYILDSLFNIVKQFQYGTQYRDTALPLVKKDNNFIIGTSRGSLNTISLNPRRQMHIFEINAEGQIIKEYLSPDTEFRNMPRAIVKTTDGGLIVATAKGYANTNSPHHTIIYWENLIVKLDANYNLEWEKELSGTLATSSTVLANLVKATDGTGYVTSGYLWENVSFDEGAFEVMLAKVSPEGDSLWIRYYNYLDGYNYHPYPHNLEVTPDGGYIITGHANPMIADSTVNRAWLLKTDQHGCLIPDCHLISNTTEISDEPELQLQLYPNPTSDFLNIFIHSPAGVASDYEFHLIDVSGKIWRSFSNRYPEETMMLSVRDLPQGMYFLEVWQKGRILKTEKIVIQK